METKPATAFVTRWVSTEGIVKFEGELHLNNQGQFGWFHPKGRHHLLMVGKDAFLSEEDAQVRAKAILRKLLKSVENKAKRIRSMLKNDIRIQEGLGK